MLYVFVNQKRIIAGLLPAFGFELNLYRTGDKMISAMEIYNFIDSFAPFESAMSFDNVGILIGDKNTSANKVLTALDVSAEVIHEAVRTGADIVVTHHPVIFKPLKSIDTDSIPYLAAKHGITIISAHTNLDIAPGGVNDTLAESIGVCTEERFCDECALVGSIPEETDCGGFARLIMEKLGLAGLRYTDNNKIIKRVVVSCGAGGDNIELAKKIGADAIITGEIKHNYIIYGNDCGIAVFDIGHFGSEGLIIPVLTQMLRERFPQTEFIRAASDGDGVKYISKEQM